MTYMLEGIRSVKKPYILTLMAIGLGCSILPAVSSSYMMRVFNITLITYLCVLSVYVLLGLCGQNSFAQAGLWGVGAYITANMVLKLGLGIGCRLHHCYHGYRCVRLYTGVCVFQAKAVLFYLCISGPDDDSEWTFYELGACDGRCPGNIRHPCFLYCRLCRQYGES